MTTILILSLFGGVALVLFGMRLAGDGLQRTAGAKLRGFLLTATDNRLKGVGVGAAITALLQSSSATTVMLVGFVGSGLMTLGQTMGVILGADIGTTITVQVIAFKVYDYAIGVIGLGVVMISLGRGRWKDVGQAVLGFGLVFFALKILIETFEPVSANPLFREFLVGLSKDPFAGIIVSALLTALFQSSAATLGIALTAALSGLLSLEAAVPIVLGANIGTTFTAVISSIGAGVEAKRVALAHTLFKALGVVIVLPFLDYFAMLVGASTADPARQVANAHTFFNIGIAAIFLPFTGPFTRLVTRLMPESKAPAKFGAKYLDPIVLSSPTLALVQASRESLRAADIVQEMLEKSIRVFEYDDQDLLEEIQEKDDDVDLLDREVKLFLTKLSRESLTEEQAKREIEIMLFSDNIENIGDVIDKNLMELARKKIKGGLSFSADGMREIKELHRRVVEDFEMGVAAFAGSDLELARRLITHKQRLSELERDLRQNHIDRLHKGFRESIDTSAIHLDVLTNLKRINSYITNVAYPVLEREKG
ncbi:MAG: Na/Pi cotransporter family protein [Deltaproteobacteria bacterium]|nr:Na/Pi cotransporter family protein [Deltaproteobacteria bacterium]MBZ0219197.1 Na/Pi cotransporter family protein [Deltaproteobacteria bacterium]